MAYSSITQLDGGPSTTSTSNKISTLSTPSPTLPDLPYTPLSLSFDDVTGQVIVNDPTVRPSTKDSSKVGKFLSSLTGSHNSYEIVEDDDYEEAHVNRTTTGGETMTGSKSREDRPVRTASVSRQLPLNHPTPDLQSLQGAYVKNVERLEESAERLSMTASLEGELQKLKMDQRRLDRTASASSRDSQRARLRHLSGQSMSNSIVDVNAAARSGGYSPQGYITSPVGSIRSPQTGHASGPFRQSSRSSKLNHMLPEPDFEGRPLDFGSMFATSSPQVHDPRPVRSPSNSSHPDRPDSAASGDTFQQANTLFNDFDGVHYHGDRPGAPRRISLTRPPLAKDAKAYKEAQPGADMIFYPAPVPVMLNLPVRLSKMNWSDREKKKMQALGEIPEDMRKSAPWLANEEPVQRPGHQSALRLPPQLRASAFFDPRGMEQNVELKDGSAVATLDSILDAAAHAPVSAFTDHPIAGNLGKDFYGPGASERKSMQKKAEKKRKKRKTRTTSTMLATGESTEDLSTELGRHSRVPSAEASRLDLDKTAEHEDDTAKSIAPSAEELSEDDDDEGDEESGSSEESDSEEESHLPGFSTAPTTLLAELQMRKAQQRQRNRTAADAFPNGMHSTLLELDTVTQLQQKARKQKHITLAWEDREAADKENFDDDDVPLGVLYPEKERKEHVNHNRPLGLMEKRELEENEPLSMRRARLRGVPPGPPAAPRSHVGDDVPTPTLDLPKLEEPESDNNAEETLGQRMKRMRDRKEKGTSGEFARQLSSELGLKAEEQIPSKMPDLEETLGQRRKRLQQEALRNGSARPFSKDGVDGPLRPVLKPSYSMADVLQRNPVGYVHPNETKTAANAMANFQRTLKTNPAYLAEQQAAAAMQSGYNQQLPVQMGYSPQQHQQPNMSYMNMGMPYMSSYSMPMPASMPMNDTMNGTMSTGMNNMMSPVYGVPGHAQGVANALGMGPPLNAKQRATIDRWRQDIA